MAVSKKLQRQFKKSFGNADFDQELLGTVARLMSLPSLTPDQEILLRYVEGFRSFIDTVQGTYELADKMQEIASRSLLVSSEEQHAKNIKLKEMNRTVEAMLNNLGEGLKAAREIQQSLIPPRHQDFDDVAIDVLYHPSEDLSGDFFDIYKKENWLYFYLADVTSHGTASAQVTYLIKGIFQEILSNSPTAPILELLTKDFVKRYIDYKLAYAVGLQVYRFDLTSKVLEVCGSSAPAAICVRGGVGQQIPVNSGPLISAASFDLEYVFQSSSQALLPGDTVYCFTDGAFELNNTGDVTDFNEKKFLKVLVQAPHEGWEESILERLRAVAGKPSFDDDITILRFYLK